MGARINLLKNSSLLFLARVANLAATFAVGIYIAKFAGVAPYGEFSFIMTLFFLFSVIFSLGLGTIASREVAKCPEKIGEYFANGTVIGIVSSAIGLVVMVAVSFLFHLSPEGRFSFYVLSLSIFPCILTFIWESLLVTLERNGSIIVVQCIEAVLKAALAFVVLDAGHGLPGLMTVLLASRLLTGILYLAVLRKVVGPAPSAVTSGSMKSMLSAVPAFAGLYIFSVIFSKIDLMMLSLLTDFKAVGIYSAAYKLLELSFILPTCVVTVMFPVLSRHAKETPATIGRTSCRAAACSALALFPVVVLAIVFAPKIINLVYSAAFVESVLPFRILILTLGLYMVDQIFAHTLVASNHQNVNLKVVIAGTLLNVSANMVLIPRYSYVGASIATLVSMIFVCITHFFFMRRYLMCRNAYQVSSVTAL